MRIICFIIAIVIFISTGLIQFKDLRYKQILMHKNIEVCPFLFHLLSNKRRLRTTSMQCASKQNNCKKKENLSLRMQKKKLNK